MTERPDRPISDLGFARVDHDREVRNGVPEVVFGEGKQADQISAIVGRLIDRHQRALVTRLDAERAERVLQDHPDGHYDPMSRLLSWGAPPKRLPGTVAVICAGTSDLPVAEEAAGTLEWLGADVARLNDVGVAGIDRLLAHREALTRADVLVVIAGMEGALPSVITGLVRNPVIAVPTSVGYGASLQGITALLGMLSACATGMSVVNIDNGFGAAWQAASILSLLERGPDPQPANFGSSTPAAEAPAESASTGPRSS
ncbi:nickel pincer cofactor biosynthesis protein LarB [Salinicola halimionae]|uniref:nickel pincer cofactor biosynthesis protein LarB n=1 Tax=Salinicola halimionae TaxID=1949081 RepID=UPI000DA1BF6E|nr:nickel pincer cofactor biosynthesis protein LarB [Salinicola halimionae]